MKVGYIALTLFCGLLTIQAFEDGCPAFSCVDGYPRHDESAAQTSTPPFTISLSASSYTTGGSITVTLSGSQGYEGFVIRAFRAPGANDPEEIVGHFSAWPAQAKGQTWIPQTGLINNCVTQADEGDFSTLVFTWVAPAADVGNVIFKATVLQGFSTFWVNVVSPVMTGGVEASPSTSVVNPDFSDFTFHDGCGSTKGCLLYPNGCSGDACVAIVAYQGLTSDSEIKFEMSMKQTYGYVSVGFSSDQIMGDELTVNCVREVDTLYVTHNSNILDDEEGKDYNVRQRITDLRDIHIKSENGRLYCSFTRARTLTFTESGKLTTGTSDLSQPVYLFVAFGDVFPDSDVVKEHVVLPVVSNKKVNLLDTVISRGRSTPLLIGVHVTFGMLGYYLISGFSMIMARHYRKELGRPCKPCTGRGLYFHIHRAIMIPMVAFGVLAIILALVVIGGWNLDPIATVHGIFALVATALMLVNIIMGFKPPKRKVFLLVHRICAILAYVFTVISFLLGSNAEVLFPDLQVTETIILAVGFGIQILIEVILEVVLCRKSSAPKRSTADLKKENSDMEMKGHENEAAEQSSEPEAAPKRAKSKKPDNYGLKMAFLALYLIGTVAVTIAAIWFGFAY